MKRLRAIFNGVKLDLWIWGKNIDWKRGKYLDVGGREETGDNFKMKNFIIYMHLTKYY